VLCCANKLMAGVVPSAQPQTGDSDSVPTLIGSKAQAAGLRTPIPRLGAHAAAKGSRQVCAKTSGAGLRNCRRRLDRAAKPLSALPGKLGRVISVLSGSEIWLPAPEGAQRFRRRPGNGQLLRRHACQHRQARIQSPPWSECRLHRVARTADGTGRTQCRTSTALQAHVSAGPTVNRKCAPAQAECLGPSLTPCAFVVPSGSGGPEQWAWTFLMRNVVCEAPESSTPGSAGEGREAHVPLAAGRLRRRQARPGPSNGFCLHLALAIRALAAAGWAEATRCTEGQPACVVALGSPRPGRSGFKPSARASTCRLMLGGLDRRRARGPMDPVAIELSRSRAGLEGAGAEAGLPALPVGRKSSPPGCRSGVLPSPPPSRGDKLGPDRRSAWRTTRQPY